MMWDHGLGGLLAIDRVVLGTGLLLLAGVTFGLVILLVRAGQGSGRGARVPLGLGVLLGVGLFAYFTPGDIGGGDAHAHVGRTWLYADAFAREHVFPIWTNRWYLGYPLGLHYGVLYFATSGLFAALLPLDVFAATKLFLWLLHITSGILVFFYVRRSGGSERAGVVAAAVFAFSFLHLGPILLSGHLPLALVFLLLPALGCGLVEWERGTLRFWPAATLLGLGLAAALVTHLQYGAFAVAFFGLWALTRTMGAAALRSWRERLALAMTSFAVAVLLSAWLLVPAWREGGELVHSASSLREEIFGALSLRDAGDAVGLFLLWSRKMRDWSYYYVGIVPLGLVALALVRRRVGRARNETEAPHDASAGSVTAPTGSRPLLAALLASLALSLIQPRFAPFVLFPVAVLAGQGAEILFAVGPRLEEAVRTWRPALARRTRRTGGETVVALLLAVLLLGDLGATLLQSPYRDFDDADLRAAAQSLESKGDTGRVLMLGTGKSAFWRSLDVVDTGLSTPFGGIPQTATKALPHAAVAGSRAAQELVDEGGELTPPTRDALRLLGVDRVVVPGRDRSLELAGHPAWFAPEVEVAAQADPIERVDWYRLKERFAERDLDFAGMSRILDRMGLDPTGPTAARIVLHRDSPFPTVRSSVVLPPRPGADPVVRPAAAVPTEPFRVSRHAESHTRAEIDYTVDVPGNLLIAYAYSTRLRVSIDGEEVPVYRSATNLTVVSTPAGAHTVTLQATLSPLRQGLLGLAAVTLLAVLAAALLTWRGRRQQRELRL